MPITSSLNMPSTQGIADAFRSRTPVDANDDVLTLEQASS